MKYLDEYRDGELTKKVLVEIEKTVTRPKASAVLTSSGSGFTSRLANNIFRASSGGIKFKNSVIIYRVQKEKVSR